MHRALQVRVLFARPVDYPAYDANNLWTALARVLDPLAQAGRLHYQHVIPANEATLRARLVGCDVLHIIAHCRDARQRKLPSLVLEGHDARGRSITPQYLAGLLGDLAASCCVVIQPPPGFEGVHDAMPQALVQGGAAAALSADAGAQGCSQFYAALSSGIPLAQALQGGKSWIRSCALADRPAPQEQLAPAPRQELPSNSDTTAQAVLVAERVHAELEEKRRANRFDVFLCHNQSDKPEVTRVAKMLTDRGILPWLDEWELRPGKPWQRLLEEQIGNIASAAVFVGADGIGPWQQQEVDALLREFVHRDGAVIPVLLVGAPSEPELPRFLQAMTWVDFRFNEGHAVERLTWGITGRRLELGQLVT